MVDVSHDCGSIGSVMHNAQVLANLGDEVIFKGALHKLVKDVGGYELMNICMREICCKWLERTTMNQLEFNPSFYKGR